MLIRDVFVSDVTRDIPPVVYFHEQSPEKLASEVAEYIITGGWPEEHPNHRRVPNGIHEQYVRILNGIASELEKKGGPELPNVWISGFYGSGKSSFAKLLGLALGGVALPDGMALAEALLRRDTSPRGSELRESWKKLRQKIDPLAVVFDIGSVARENEQIHAAAVRQVQKHLDYCSTEPLVADFELRLERDGQWPAFLKAAETSLGRPWVEVKDRALAEEDFSLVLSTLSPDHYTDPMSWINSRAGYAQSQSPEEAVAAIRDMLRFRRPNSTLLLIIDEVSQYVLSSKDRVDRLRAFATALGATLKGKAWLLALGQQKLDEEADDSFLVWAKDRFPPQLRVHLSATNIRDVVHKRLLQKRPEVERELRDLFDRHRPDLKLFAYGCESVTAEDFVEVYPMLPGHIDLLLQITSAMRTRSTRVQGDDQAIRGLLQLLGELFRDQELADMPVGRLVTLDQIYEVQHTALDSDVQASMARILNQCSAQASGLLVRAAKAVALLELVQETTPTDAKLVAQCLYDAVDRGNQVSAVTEALEELRRRNLLGYSEKLGYKIQSSAGEEWERERRDLPAPRESWIESVIESLRFLMAEPEQPRLEGRPFPWSASLSDGRRKEDASIADRRDDATVRVDFRFVGRDERIDSTWVRRSAESPLDNRIVWVCGDTEQVEDGARELARSQAMVRKYKPRRESLPAARKLLLQQEENRTEDLLRIVRDAVASSWLSGVIYFRARVISPADQGSSFGGAIHSVATQLLPSLFNLFVATQLQPAELLPLLEIELSGPSQKFLQGELGILELDQNRYVPACSGIVPQRIREHIEREKGVSGTALLSHFGGPPYGYTANVLKACIAGLLRASKVRVEPEGATPITAVRDAGVRDLFDKDRTFRRATFSPVGADDIGFPVRARICKFFESELRHTMDREDHVIADAVATYFPPQAQRLRDVLKRLSQLPELPATPRPLDLLESALEQCVRVCRQTQQTVQAVKKHLDALQDGMQLLNLYDAELTKEGIAGVRKAFDVHRYEAAQLKELGVLATNVDAARTRIETHLASERPWRDVAGLETDLAEVRAAYVSERQRLLEAQEQQVEQARGRVKIRDGFSTLTADQAHHVLRPLTSAVSDTTEEAIAPSLVALKQGFAEALPRAEDAANEHLDALLSEGAQPLIRKLDLALRNRELSTEGDVEALLQELRARLLEQIRAGVRIRLV